MMLKFQISKEMNRKVENQVGDKKQVVNRRIRKTMRIMVAHINPIDERGKAELEKIVGETSRLLEVLVQQR